VFYKKLGARVCAISDVELFGNKRERTSVP
jgi:hypothetical protein